MRIRPIADDLAAETDGQTTNPVGVVLHRFVCWVKAGTPEEAADEQ